MDNVKQIAKQTTKELTKLIRARLGDPKIKDKKNIFTDKQIESFINYAVIEMATLLGTDRYKLGSKDIVVIAGLIVDHAVIQALASQALIEKGREITIKDNGVNFTPPDVSSTLMAQYTIEYNAFLKKIDIFIELCKSRSS